MGGVVVGCRTGDIWELLSSNDLHAEQKFYVFVVALGTEVGTTTGTQRAVYSPDCVEG